jgi:hypothetical protein
MSLAVSEVSRRRADQFCDLVGVLELGAIDLDAGAGVAKKSLGHGFDDARFARPSGPEEKEVAYGTSWGIEPGQEHLVDLGDLFDGLVLPNDAAAQGSIKLSGITAATVRIEHSCEIRSHKVLPGLPDVFPFGRFLRLSSVVHPVL